MFSRKKKLTKDEREELEKAREELKKIKESRENEFVPNIKIENDSEKIYAKRREELRQKEDLEKLNQTEEKEILARPGKTYDDTNQFGVCCATDCDVPESDLNGKECKFCNKFCCLDHLLCHKHDCIKDKHVKFVRKQWIRKYGLNVSTGQYNVVCDVCGYVSPTASLIENAGEGRLSHILKKGCDSTKVFLESIE